MVQHKPNNESKAVLEEKGDVKNIDTSKEQLTETGIIEEETTIVLPEGLDEKSQRTLDQVLEDQTLGTSTSAADEIEIETIESPLEAVPATIRSQDIPAPTQAPKQTPLKLEAQVEPDTAIQPSSSGPSDVVEDKVFDETIVKTPPAIDDEATSLVEEKKFETKRPTLRTLNITSEMVETLRRSESQAPLSTTTEKSTAFPTLSQIRQSSRQPSISVSTNISRPSTPAASDRFGLFSQDVSRAGSPPPGGSVVGSAPSRQKTKNQAKKDRREKAKKVTETPEAGSVIAAAATPPTADEVGPIVARQKKQKKSKSAGAANVTEPRKKPDDAASKEEITKEKPQPKDLVPPPSKKDADQVSATKEPEPLVVERSPTPTPPTPTPASPEQTPVSYTLRDFYTDASKIHSLYQEDEQISDEQITTEIQDRLASNVSAFPKLLSEMVASGDLAKDHPLFNPPPFTSAPYKLPSDNRKGQAYLDGNNYSCNDVFGMIYLPQKEKKALYHGHAVSIADPVLPPTNNGNATEPKEDLLRRCLITPTGWVLRHLSRDESEKLLDLEERRQMYLEEFGDLGRMDKLGALEENDYVNLEGGFDEISRFGDRHGVCWVMDQDNGRGGRRQASRTNDDDYGLGEMPIDADDFDGEEDRYDDPEDEDDEDIDEEELDGEDLIQRIVAEDERYDEEEDDDLGSFANLTTDPNMSMTLPPLPPSMMMNMNMGMPTSGNWNDTYPQRTSHTMYGSLNTPNASGLPYTSTGHGYATDEMLPPTSELPVPRASTSNTLPPIRQGHGHGSQDGPRVNLRAMSEEELSRRVKEKQKEMESARREAERIEKLMGRKGKELGRWRGETFKGATVGGV